MIIEAARYADGELHLKCDPREGIQATYKLEAGKDYDIVPHREKRSLNANSYAWALIHCEQFDSGTPGFVTIRCVYGSSDYDRAEMALLIDRLVQDAQALGIETKPQEDIDSLLRSWKA